jgi:invasion protein IalB
MIRSSTFRAYLTDFERLAPYLAGFAAFALTVGVSLAQTATTAPAPAAAPTPVALATNDTGWQVLCRPQDAARTKLACTMFQEIVVARDRSRVLGVELTRPDKVLLLTAMTPVNVSLKDGVTLNANGEKLAAPFLSCQATGCIARFEIAPKILDRLKAAKNVAFEFFDVQGSKVHSELSMTGFGLALNKLDQAN